MFTKIVSLATLCTLFACGSAVTPIKTESDELRITIDSIQTRFDTIQLGRMIEGERVNGSFIVENRGEKPLVIANIVTGCGCTTTNFNGMPIPPAGEAKVDFTFDSKGRSGLQLKIIDLISSDYFTNRIVIQAFVKEQ